MIEKRSTLTSILDRLAARGLITRQVDATDRRTFIVTPTARGRQVAGRVHRHLDALERAVGSRVTADDVRGFARVVAVVEEETRKFTR